MKGRWIHWLEDAGKEGVVTPEIGHHVTIVVCAGNDRDHPGQVGQLMEVLHFRATTAYRVVGAFGVCIALRVAPVGPKVPRGQPKGVPRK